MTKNFSSLSYTILDIVRKEESIKDVLLMMRLGFTPDNWRHWRSMFVQFFEEITYPKENSDDENNKEKVVYVKKQRLWIIQDA